MMILNADAIKCSINISSRPSQLTEGSLKCKKKSKIYTEEFFSQHAQLLLVEALTSEGGKLPAEDLGELAPGGPRRVTEERQVLSNQKGCTENSDTLTRAHHHGQVIIILMIILVAHPGFIGQKVVPHDGCPASRQLAHIRDDHQR